MKSKEAIGLLLLATIVAVDCLWVSEMENPGMFEGDIVLDPDEREGILKTNSFASIKGGRWPNAKIPYVIDSSIESYGVTAIQNAIDNYHKYTCLRFHVRKGESSYLRFYRGGGCSSPVGYVAGRVNSVSLGGGCWHTGIAMHEIGHSIGIYHEQSRPDRDQHVRILWNNIQSSMRFNFDKKGQGDINSLGTPYDFSSMMHYGATAFGDGRRTIETIDPSKQRLIGQRSGFSEIDIKQINLMYCGGPGPSASIEPPTLPPTNRPVSIPQGCVNKDSNCEDFAANGWCTDNKERDWMKANCCAACTGARCADRHTRCNEWANRGECKINPNYMLRVCQVSCKQC